MADFNISVNSSVLTGETLWVDAVNGNDSTGARGVFNKPFLTVQAAVTAASSGDTVYVRRGTYTSGCVLKDGVDIDHDPGVLYSMTVNTINQTLFTDSSGAVTCKITGKPDINIIQGSAGACMCMFVQSAGSDIYIDIGRWIGDLDDTDLLLYMEAGTVRGSVEYMKTTSYDGIWLSGANAKCYLSVIESDCGDNPVELSSCADCDIRIQRATGSGILVQVAGTDEVHGTVSIGSMTHNGNFYTSFIRQSGAVVDMDINIGLLDAASGDAIKGLCDGIRLTARIVNATNPIDLDAGVVGYLDSGGLLLNCILEGSGDAITSPSAKSIYSQGSRTLTAVGTNVTVEGDLFYDQGGPSDGQVPVSNDDGTWSWGDLTASDVGADALGSAAAAQAAAEATASADATTKANAAQAFAIQRANHTGTQAVSTLGGLPARSMVTNNTGSSAAAGTSTFNDPGVQAFAETITWTAGAAPSGATNHTLNWTQVGNLVSYQIFLRFATSGTTVTALSFAVPSGMPAPLVPSGVTGGGAMLYPNTVRYANGTTGLFLNNSTGGIRRNSGDSATEFSQAGLTSGTYNTFVIFGQYWTA